MRKKYTLQSGTVRTRSSSICFQALAMAVGGWISVEISKVWTRPFFVGTEEQETAAVYEEKNLGDLFELTARLGKLTVQESSVRVDVGPVDVDHVFSDNSLEKVYMPAEERKKDMTSPERLNYAFLFDEDDQKTDCMESYAGRVYHQLSERDGTWLREIYGLGEMPPEEMAAHLGIEIGDISSWNRVKVTFRNGDDIPVSGYSNAKEIVSLASVYAYFQQWNDYESFFQYADRLWKSSHSYRIFVSDLYYCEGDCQYIETSYLETEDGTEDVETEDSSEAVGTGDIEIGEDAGIPGDTENHENAENAPDEWAQTELSGGEAETEIGPGVETASGTFQETAAETDMDSHETMNSETVSENICLGHMDLNISVKITGLEEMKSLYEEDPVGNLKEYFNDRWHGWDLQARSYSANLADQDWYDLYGLFSSNSAYVRNPLSESEIAFYLNKLPDTVSPRRRELIRQALASVGCIPYYWGGKPSGGGFESNQFGTVVEPDEDGRILRGLDCSGWISWVYWTAFGEPVPAQSTSGLISLGRGIAKEELQAGDILVRTGEQPHVYLFLAWAEDGSMYLIHETTGNVNNVTVNTYDVEVSHYRDLIGEE